MNVLFFHLLHTDVQAHIFHEWIGDAKTVTQTLSSLDVACCQTTARTLMTGLISIGGESNPVPIGDVEGFFHWLHDRKVPVTSILLKGSHRASTNACAQHDIKPSFYLPLIVSLTVAVLPDDGGRTFERVLRVCPNITSLEILSNRTDFCPSYLWTVLACVPVKICSLTCLHLAQNWETGGLDPEMLRCLAVIGFQLKALNLRHVLLTNVLSVLTQCCLNLEQLTVFFLEFDPCRSFYSPPKEVIITLLQSCKLLSDLVLVGYGPTEIDLNAVLLAGKGQLKRFDAPDNHLQESGLFSTILEKHTWLDHFKLTASEYHRSAGYLVLSKDDVYELPLSCLQRVCQVCHNSVTNLSINSSLVTIDSVQLLGAVFGTHLNELAMTCSDPNILQLMLSWCPNLQILHLGARATEAHLEIVARWCPLLVYLSLGSTDSDTTDTALQHVIAGCPLLNRLELLANCSPNVTKQTLQALLDSRTQLDTLQCKMVGFVQSDVDQFRAQARKHQLLPVPTVVADFSKVDVVMTDAGKFNFSFCGTW